MRMEYGFGDGCVQSVRYVLAPPLRGLPLPLLPSTMPLFPVVLTNYSQLLTVSIYLVVDSFVVLIVDSFCSVTDNLDFSY